MRAAITTLALLLAAADAPSAPEPSAYQMGTLTVSGPQHVQDALLLSGKYWGKWNFGNAQFLEVGVQPSTVYDVYRAVSLIRFDFSGLQYAKVETARLRIYIPRNQTQMAPVPIHVHAVSAANAGWKKGASEAEETPKAACWNCRARGLPWAGGPGLSRPGLDYAAEPLATKTADGLKGEWLEFDLPQALVQSWMDAPDANAGLLLRTDENAEPGQHTCIMSSRQWSGNGPQLVIRGKLSGAKVSAGSDSQIRYDSRFELPPMGPVYERWLNECTERYAVWAKDKSINLTGSQAVFPYLWDVIVRGDIILPKSMLPLSRITEEVPQVVARGDKQRARQIMEDFMKDMMVFDYARDQIWYDSSPTAEFLSPLQVAKFFVKDADDTKGAHAIYSGIDSDTRSGRWDDCSAETIESRVKAQLELIKERLKPTAKQCEAIETVIRTNMPLEFHHAIELKKSLALVHRLISSETDGLEMLKAIRGMFFHHRMFLIHQSLFSMPKYSVLIENGDILGYAKWMYDVREKQYSPGRVARQLVTATSYRWQPSEHQEAEYASFRGCEWSNEKPGYSGTGYVVFSGKPGSDIDWEVNMKAAGMYRLSFRYSLPGQTGRPLRLAVEGVPLETPLLFAPTDRDPWAMKSVPVKLPSGGSRIQLSTLENAGPDVDYLDIQPIEFAK